MRNIILKIDQAILSMKNFVKFFAKDVRGMSGVMITMSLIPTIGVIGIATDVSRTYIVKTRLSSALDSAALAGGKSMFDSDREAQIKKYFDANFPTGFYGSTVTGPFEIDANGNTFASGHQYTENDTVLRLKATVSVPTTFMKLFDFQNMTTGGEAEVTRETSLLDVVMAVDMSGSMLQDVNGNHTSVIADRRISLAKAAASDLVDVLFGSDEENALLSIGLVPWSGKVNVTDNGTTYGKDEFGNNLPASSLFTTEAIVTSPNNPYRQENYTYQSSTTTKEWINGAWVYTTTYNDHFVLKNWTDKVDKVYYAHNAPTVPLLAEPPTDWKGCVYARYARTKDYFQSNSYIDSVAESNAGDLHDGPYESVTGPAWVGWYPMGDEGETSSCELKSLNKLSSNCTTCPTYGITSLQHKKSTMKTAIDNLNIPSGSFYTNIPQGLSWAWRAITPGKPFDQATIIADPNYKKHKAIILLTDGENTVRNADAYNYGFGTSSKRDQRLKDLADAIKQKNDANPDNDDEILIYTIQFANTNQNLVDLLKYVATNDDFYFYAPDSASLKAAFKKIAKDLSKLRLSK